MAALHFAQRAGQQEQLLKNKSAPRKLKILEARRKMNIFIRVSRLCKLVFFPQALGQHLRQLGSAGIKCLTYSGHNKLLRKPSREPVHRNYAPRDAADCALTLDHRVCHRALSANADNLAIYIQAVAAMDIVFDIRLVEKRYVNRTTLVNDTELYKLKSPAYAHKPGILRREGVYAHCLPVAGQRDRLKAAAILIFPRKIRNKVTDVNDAELIEKLRLFFAYALAVSYISIKIIHFLSLNLHKASLSAGAA